MADFAAAYPRYGAVSLPQCGADVGRLEAKPKAGKTVNLRRVGRGEAQTCRQQYSAIGFRESEDREIPDTKYRTPIK